MTTVLGCIADDFTGATDLAGLLARSGLPVSLKIGVPTEPPKTSVAFEVIALKSRTAPVDEAITEARAALSWLQATGAKRFFWKYCSTFDSTAKGNIGSVAEALMSDLAVDQTVYCPAFPDNGRTVYMGNLFVGQQPLAESPMKNHPLTPMRDSNLMRLLEPQVTKPVGLVDRNIVSKGPGALSTELNRLKDSSVAHVIIDTVVNDDLNVIADACCDLPLITGGSAVAAGLPALYLANGTLTKSKQELQHTQPVKDTIVLSGSCSSMTNKQVQHYINLGVPTYSLDPITLSNEGDHAVLTWLAQQDLKKAPLIYATAEPASVKAAQKKLGVATAGELVEKTLAACAVTARDLGARRFIVAGGETSGAVTQALAITELNVGVEIAPGVPWTYCTSEGQSIALTLKSGNFGRESFFTDAQSKLEDDA